jgi:hypothetical protein
MEQNNNMQTISLSDLRKKFRTKSQIVEFYLEQSK